MYKFGGFLAFFLFSIAFSAKSQSFEKGTKVANLGLGVGYGIGVLASAEVGVEEDISVGVVGGLTRRSYGGYLGSNWGVNYAVIGLRGSYHFNKILKEFDVVVDKLDPYIGATGGLRVVSYDNSWSGYGGVGTGPMFGGYIGARYQLKQKLGVMVEVGAPFSTGGVTFKF
jgi:hypothetical protein